MQHELVAERLQLVVHRRDRVRVELVLQVGDEEAHPVRAPTGQRAAGVAGDVAERGRAAARTRCRVSSETLGLSRRARDTVGWLTPARRATSWLVTTLCLLCWLEPGARARAPGLTATHALTVGAIG